MSSDDVRWPLTLFLLLWFVTNRSSSGVSCGSKSLRRRDFLERQTDLRREVANRATTVWMTAEIGCVTKTKRTPDSDSRGRSDGLSPLRMRPVAPAVGRSFGPIRSADPRFRAVSAADKQLQIKQTWPGQARPGHPDPHLSKWSENAPSSRRGNVLWTNSSRSLRSLRNLSRNLGNLGNLRSLFRSPFRSLGPVVRRAAAFRRSPCRRHKTSPSSHRRFPLHRE